MFRQQGSPGLGEGQQPLADAVAAGVNGGELVLRRRKWGQNGLKAKGVLPDPSCWMSAQCWPHVGSHTQELPVSTCGQLWANDSL